jgi:hypothetical protein
MRGCLAAVAILQLAAAPAFAHRLDEYLQGTILSVERGRLTAQITLAPGIAVLPVVLAAVPADGREAVPESVQRAYAMRVLRELNLALDEQRLAPQLVSVRFSGAGEMKEGLGEIRIEFTAELPHGSRNRRLHFENHHQGRISVYLVNCLVPRDPAIRVIAQHRNPSQSVYDLEYEDAAGESQTSSLGLAATGRGLIALLLFLCARFAWAWRSAHATPSKAS